MPVTRCRLCGGAFMPAPLLRYEGMPGAAQFMPDAGSVAGDKGITLEVCQCADCGLVQLSNDPVPYHREVIRAAAVSPEMKAFRRRQFGAFVRRYGLAAKTIIEVGCGRGEYLDIMAETGARVYGIEASREAVNECQRRGLRVTQGFVDSGASPLAAAPFDAFFVLNFLEHLPDVGGVLKGIRSNLADAAVGLVEVPNFDMILRNNVFSEFISDHLFYFTRDTLDTALRLKGFDVVACRPVWHDYILSAVVRKRGRIDLSAYAESQRRLQDDVDAFVGRFPAGRVAVWGAGHQALTILALLRMGPKVRYVVDSAPFKQGKFTPATHLRIVAPAALDTDPVAAIVVMAASYSDEVAGLIRQKYGSTMGLAIVREHGLEILQR